VKLSLMIIFEFINLLTLIKYYFYQTSYKLMPVYTFIFLDDSAIYKILINILNKFNKNT
jgi:hypothetical protein